MFGRRLKVILRGVGEVINTPIRASLSYKWNFGSILGVILIRQILTGLFLVIFYVRDATFSFFSVEYIIREVGSGWFFRVLHLNGARFLFVCLYLHVRRGIVFGRFRLWKVWRTGIILLLLVIGEAFLGYVLPWGQISVWGACVITSLLRVLPWVGSVVVVWVWGGLVVNRATLGCFLILHYLLPFTMLVFVIFHILFLHETGRRGRRGATDRELKIKFFPYFVSKDAVDFCFIRRLVLFCCLLPFFLGDCENFKEANLINSPVHIQPEWYFLFIYAILRAVPNKLGGVVAIVASLLAIWALASTSWGEQRNWRIGLRVLVSLLIIVTVVLTFLGASPVESPLVLLRQVFTGVYFFFLIVILRFYVSVW